MQLEASASDLIEIPVVETGADFAIETLEAFRPRVLALLDQATKGVPPFALRQLDRVSRRWLQKWANPHLDEIDRIAKSLARPGVYFFSVNYEWGCTCRVASAPDHGSARLIRVLDWRTPGLGRNLVAAKVRAAPGVFITLTWPGYTGVLTAMAPGRFSAALNQAPMATPVGVMPLDWAVNRGRVWRTPFGTPAHLLRHVFEHAASFVEARELLISTPISTPAIYSLAGVQPQDTVVIERTEQEARVHAGSQVSANHWQAPGWVGRARGDRSDERARRMSAVEPEFDAAWPWLSAPILNERTRLVAMADARRGVLLAQGFEGFTPATRPLRIEISESFTVL